MKLKYFLLLLASYFIITISCNTTEPPIILPPPSDTIANTITLTVEWTDLYRIKLKWNKSVIDTAAPFNYRLLQLDEAGNQTTKDFTITGTDTSYIIGEPDSLPQGMSFWFKVEGYNLENKLKDTSQTITTQTLQPTSHNIVWTVDTLGQPGNFLNDVWGLDENNVYAVGYIELPEGSSSIVKWEGNSWKPFTNVGGVKYGIFGFNENSIFVVGESSNRGIIGIWDGISWTEYRSDYFLARGDTVYPLRSVWGSSPDDVWAVGSQGTIIHWDGVEWKKVDVDSNLNSYDFLDIWGHSNSEIYIAGRIYQQKVLLLKYNGISWEIVIENSSLSRFSTTWGPHERLQYLIEDLRNIKIENDIITTFVLPGRSSAIHKIRGSGNNNIFTAGSFGEIFHYDGITWQKMEINNTFLEQCVLTGCYVTENEVFFIGYNPGIGVIFVRGKS